MKNPHRDNRERRKYPRYRIERNILAAVETRQMRAIGSLYDASDRGFSIRASWYINQGSLKKDETCTVEFLIGSHLLKRQGKVVRCKGEHVSITLNEPIGRNILEQIVDGAGAICFYGDEVRVLGTMTNAVATTVRQEVRNGRVVNLREANGEEALLIAVAKHSINTHGRVKGCSTGVKSALQQAGECDKCAECPSVGVIRPVKGLAECSLAAAPPPRPSLTAAQHPSIHSGRSVSIKGGVPIQETDRAALGSHYDMLTRENGEVSTRNGAAAMNIGLVKPACYKF